MILGAAVAVGGLLLALAPLTAARAANTLRFVPYSDDPSRLRAYRIAGAVIAVVGIFLVLTL